MKEEREKNEEERRRWRGKRGGDANGSVDCTLKRKSVARVNASPHDVRQDHDLPHRQQLDFA